MRPTEKGRDAEASSARLAANFEELRARLSPQNLRRRAVQALSESGPVRFAVNAGDVASNNAAPLVLMLGGILWAVATRTTGPGPTEWPTDRSDQTYSAERES